MSASPLTFCKRRRHSPKWRSDSLCCVEMRGSPGWADWRRCVPLSLQASVVSVAVRCETGWRCRFEPCSSVCLCVCISRWESDVFMQGCVGFTYVITCTACMLSRLFHRSIMSSPDFRPPVESFHTGLKTFQSQQSSFTHSATCLPRLAKQRKYKPTHS